MFLPWPVIRRAICLLLAGGTACGLELAESSAASSTRLASSAVQPDPQVRAAPARGATAYPAEVVKTLDGDTFEARVQVWPGIDITTKVRLRGIDTPELKSRCIEERMKAESARDSLAAILAEGRVEISAVGLDKFGGRVDADVSTQSTPDVAAALLQAGLARGYGGGQRVSWCGS